MALSRASSTGALMFVIVLALRRWDPAVAPAGALRVQRTLAIGRRVLAGRRQPAGLGGLVWRVRSILLPALIYMVSHGIHQPCGQAWAQSALPKAGTAPAMSGFLMMVVAFSRWGSGWARAWIIRRRR